MSLAGLCASKSFAQEVKNSSHVTGPTIPKEPLFSHSRIFVIRIKLEETCRLLLITFYFSIGQTRTRPINKRNIVITILSFERQKLMQLMRYNIFFNKSHYGFPLNNNRHSFFLHLFSGLAHARLSHIFLLHSHFSAANVTSLAAFRNSTLKVDYHSINQS